MDAIQTDNVAKFRFKNPQNRDKYNNEVSVIALTN
jgi:hypothetical protein